MAEVSLENIEKVYDNGFHAIKDLSLSVSDGEFLVLVGPSGCGKTTALRMIAGLEQITAVAVHLGTPAQAVAQQLVAVGQVPEQQRLPVALAGACAAA